MDEKRIQSGIRNLFMIIEVKGEISTSMGVNTKPAHSFEVNGYWILIDPKMPEKDFLKLKEIILANTE